jgi:hypothetical protein
MGGFNQQSVNDNGGVAWVKQVVRHEARCFLGEVRDLSWSFVAAGG